MKTTTTTAAATKYTAAAVAALAEFVKKADKTDTLRELAIAYFTGDEDAIALVGATKQETAAVVKTDRVKCPMTGNMLAINDDGTVKCDAPKAGVLENWGKATPQDIYPFLQGKRGLKLMTAAQAKKKYGDKIGGKFGAFRGKWDAAFMTICDRRAKTLARKYKGNYTFTAAENDSEKSGTHARVLRYSAAK